MTRKGFGFFRVVGVWGVRGAWGLGIGVFRLFRAWVWGLECFWGSV